MSDPRPLLDPKNDYVFKRLFVEAPELLVELINAVRADEPDIRSLQILNPNIEPLELTGKYIILDVLAEDVQGHRYNVEMQVRRYSAWSARSTYYLARMLSQQLDSGTDYSRLKPAIGIHLLDFDLFTEPQDQQQATWCFEMRDRQRPDVLLGKELQLNLVELKKADRLGLAPGPLEAWVTFFEHWQEELTMANIAYEPVKTALSTIKHLSADEETRRLAFVRERAVRDELTLLKEAEERGIEKGIEQGIEQGIEKGIEKGRAEGEAKILQKLLKLRFGPLSATLEARISQASTEEIECWTDRILEAASLEDVFRD